jgi:signal transduction histidine kinase
MQVLNNLLSNAIKFSPDNVIVALHIERKKSDNKNDKNNKGNANTQHILTFKVIDKGIGIEQQDIKRLFKPFSQINSELSRNYTGTGLGLSIAKNLVNVMGGELRCHK